MSELAPYLPASTADAVDQRRTWRRLPRTGIALFIVSFWLGIIWVAAVAPLNAPDEPAYLQAVMATRNKRMLPEIHFDFRTNPSGDLVGDPGDPAARSYAIQHNQNDPIRLTPYQNSQPPLYFLIAGPVAMLLPSDPQVILYVSRLISILFGAGTIFFSWAAARQLLPRSPMWAVAAAAVIALLPQFNFNNARVGNDSLVNCIAAAAYYVWFRSLRQPGYDPWMLRSGVAVGLALLAKLTAVALLPALALVIVFRLFQAQGDRDKWRARLLRGARMVAGSGGALLVVCGWWLLRNLLVYGDPTGTSGVNKYYLAVLQVPGFNLSTPEQQSQFVEATWKSFWGFFGWQNIPMPDAFYSQVGFFAILFLGLTVLAALALLVWRFIRRQRSTEKLTVLPTYAWQAALVMAVVGLALIFAFVQYSLQVSESAQGRYLFLMLLPASILFTGGLYALPPHRVLKVLALCIPILWLAAMNFVALNLAQLIPPS